VGTLILFLILGEMVSVSTIKYDVGCGFVIYSLHDVEILSFLVFLVLFS
jgi:hypothetical protein